MRIQLLSDLHLETEAYAPRPAPGAELLILAGDICSRWGGYERFRGWPQPVIVVAGNHEFDGRELNQAWPALRRHCADLGLRLLERESMVLRGSDGRSIRFVGSVRWSDFDLFGERGRARAMRSASHYLKIMQSTLDGAPFDALAVRSEALACREWLRLELERGPDEAGGWDATVVITHYAPSLRSADPRYGAQPGTASFCNADDDLLAGTQLWLHGHLHCRHDYRVEHRSGSTRVVSNARGYVSKGEAPGHDPLFAVDV